MPNAVALDLIDPRLTRDLTQPEPVPPDGIARALELMQSGRLHRYGETGGRGSETALLEEEFAASVGARYCVAMSSCGATLFAAIKALGVKPGDAVLTNAFTLAPVPSRISLKPPAKTFELSAFPLPALSCTSTTRSSNFA